MDHYPEIDFPAETGPDLLAKFQTLFKYPIDLNTRELPYSNKEANPEAQSQP
jgi:hypothetical protein